MAPSSGVLGLRPAAGRQIAMLAVPAPLP